MKILVTGAAGKVGQAFIQRFLAERDDGSIRAFCHNRMLKSRDRLDVVQGSLASKSDVDKAMDGITHVLHLATCKETPNDIIDVTDFVGDSEKEKEALRVMKEFAWEHNMPLKGKVLDRLKSR